jgi:signal transduction histidine kinase
MQVQENDIIFIVIIGSCCLIIAAFALIMYVRLYNEKKKKHFEEKSIMAIEFDRQLMQSALETQEATMSMLSKELHDNIGQLLNSTKLLIGVTERSLPSVPETLVTAGETLGRAIQELRSLSKSMDKEWLTQFNLVENLEAETIRVNSAQDLRIHFTKPDSLPLKSGEQVILFRIVQETLQNAIKHANAANVYITISNHSGILKVTVRDDGSGFDETRATKGLGFRNIGHRTHLLGGTVNWQSASGKGTTVTIELPTNQTDT